MIQERFDELAKGLATKRLSRRQVIKTFAASAFVGAFSLFGSQRIATAGATKVAIQGCVSSSADPNLVRGSCDCFKQYANKVGTTDALGISHKGSYGNTLCDWFALQPIPTELKCQTCKNVRSRTDCAQVACSQDLKNVCISTTVFRAFTATTETNKLTWEPDPAPCDQCLCDTGLVSYHNWVEQHEQEHAAQCKQLAENLSWRGREFTGCGKTWDAADTDLANKIESAQEATVKEANKTYEEQSNAIDIRDGPLVEAIVNEMCTRCAPCPSSAARERSSQVQSVVCGDACCDSCEECKDGQCVPKECGDCETCNLQTGACESTCGSCQTCEGGQCRNCNACETCENGTCTPIAGGELCGEACCGSCQTCEAGQCRNCNQCEECQGGTCVPIDCGSPCLECREGACFPKECGPCEACNERTGTCESTCGSCQVCEGGSCRNCSGCETCENGTCVSVCGSCQVCEAGQCRNCNQCEECQNGACVPKECAPPKALNPATCECECPVSCPPPQTVNPETCGCECAVTCPPDQHLNPETCECEEEACDPPCGPCETCRDGSCVPVDCGSPCLECREGACFPKECGDCEVCDEQTGACESTCGSCQTCDGGQCRNCNQCETCENGSCVPIPDAKPCGDACCGSCQICDGGQCRNCNGCETCENGSCVSACGSCQKCDNGVCRNPDQTQCEACVNGEVTPPAPERACIDPRTGGFLGCCAEGAVCGASGFCCGERAICPQPEGVVGPDFCCSPQCCIRPGVCGPCD